MANRARDDEVSATTEEPLKEVVLPSPSPNRVAQKVPRRETE